MRPFRCLPFLLGGFLALPGCQGDGSPADDDATADDDDATADDDDATADDDTTSDDDISSDDDATSDDDTSDDDTADDDTTPKSAELDLYLNEFMATNASTVADETGAFPDWVEVWNGSSVTADLTGVFLTDDLTLPTRWEFPEGTLIPGHGYLLVWADGDADAGGLHTSFKLAADGEELGLFGPKEEGNETLDALTYEAQATDISMARMPDGSNSWEADSSPTPGEANE